MGSSKYARLFICSFCSNKPQPCLKELIAFEVSNCPKSKSLAHCFSKAYRKTQRYRQTKVTGFTIVHKDVERFRKTRRKIAIYIIIMMGTTLLLPRCACRQAADTLVQPRSSKRPIAGAGNASLTAAAWSLPAPFQYWIFRKGPSPHHWKFNWKWPAHTPYQNLVMMMIAFVTIKSSLVPLIEGLCARKSATKKMEAEQNREKTRRFFVTQLI